MHLFKAKSIALAGGMVLGAAVLATLTGCIGFVGGGGDVDVVAPGPDFYIFGGGYDRGRDVHAYSDRGHASRAVAHSGDGGHGGGHGGGR
jgi:hypothetical protein